MPAPRRHVTHSLSLPWEDLITTWYTSCPCTNLSYTGSQLCEKMDWWGWGSFEGLFWYNFVWRMWRPCTPRTLTVTGWWHWYRTLMKTLERLVLVHPLVIPSMAPLQFFYQPGIGEEDGIIYLFHRSLSHLEKAESTVRIMIFDFSSAFNSIQPLNLSLKSYTAFERQIGAHRVRPPTNSMDSGLPYQLATVCEDTGLWVRHGCMQHGSRTVNSFGSFLLHPWHCRFQVQLNTLPLAKVFSWQVRTPSSFTREHPGNWHWDDEILQVLGHSPE